MKLSVVTAIAALLLVACTAGTTKSQAASSAQKRSALAQIQECQLNTAPTPGERVRSMEEFVYCEDLQLPSGLFKRKNATRFLVVDFRPGCAGQNDITLGRRAANAVDGLLRDSLLRVAAEEAAEQMLLAESLEVVRLQCVVKDETAARILGKNTGADLVIWGDAVCPLRALQGQPLVNITQTVEAKDGSKIVPRDIIAHVELPKGEIGSFCTRATMTSEGWPIMGSGRAQTQSADVLEGASLELPQVVAGDALGLTLFVGGLHFFKREDYPHALNLFRSASRTLRTDSKSAADLLWAMGQTEYMAGRFDAAAGFCQRCEDLVEDTSDRWWKCRLTRLDALRISSKKTPQIYTLASETLERARAAQRKLSEATTLNVLARLAQDQEQWDSARTMYKQALMLHRGNGSSSGEADIFHDLGGLELVQRNWDAARTNYEESLKLCRDISAETCEANALLGLGRVAEKQEQLDTARMMYEKALVLNRTSVNKLGEANTLQCLGDLELSQEKWAIACKNYEEALALYQAVGEERGEAYSLFGSAQCLDNMEQYEEADKRHEQAAVLLEQFQEWDRVAKNDTYYGLSLTKRGDLRRAREILNHAYQLHVRDGNIGWADLVLQTLRQLDSEMSKSPIP